MKALNYLKNKATNIKNIGAVAKCEVRAGKIAEEIIKVADENNIDLVAMSTHGRSGLGQWAFGSVTAKVLRGGHTPVLMVRASEEAEKM